MTQVPFTMLTGFLGAGKTTVLNRLLGAPLGKKIAVLVNDVGRINIDRQLIKSQSGDLIELSGGCVCCKLDLQKDLLESMSDLIGRAAPDQLVLETSGIAEPSALIERLDEVAAVKLAGVIAVVDGQAGAPGLVARAEMREQVRAADRVLLTKLDLASADEVTAVHAALDSLNASAERVSFPAGNDAALTRWLLEPRSRTSRVPARAHVHSQLTVVTHVDDHPLVGAALLRVVESLGASLLRCKGFVAIAGEPRRAFLERAGRNNSLAFAAPWGNEPRRTELVFIGDELDEPALQRQLWACRANA